MVNILNHIFKYSYLSKSFVFLSKIQGLNNCFNPRLNIDGQQMTEHHNIQS